MTDPRAHWSPALVQFLTPRRDARGYEREEVLDWPFFDFRPRAQARRLTLFSRPWTHNETNMDIPFCLPCGKRFGATSLSFRLNYAGDATHSPKLIGSCPKCGAPITGSSLCEYCYVRLPPLFQFAGSIHGVYNFSILNKTYSEGKILGPVSRFDFKIPLPIPEQCHFKIEVEFDRDVESLYAELGGILVRPVC